MNRHPGKIHSGAEFEFDPEVVSYWSQWLGHPTPKILVVGQDFGDKDYFEKFKGFDDPRSETNKNLYQLLIHIGLTPTKPPVCDRSTPVFLTNSVLCLKEPPMNAPLRDAWIRACATQHLRPLLDRLRPPIVIAMGRPAWLAVRVVFGIKEAPEMISAAAGGRWITQAGTQVFAVGHCSGLGIRNRPWQTQLDDWARVGVSLRQLPQMQG